MLKGGYTFEEYSVAVPYKEVDDTETGVAANEARALRARSHMAALVSQNGLFFRYALFLHAWVRIPPESHFD